jgi:DNA invertase Pin-like site-specific DNA recombinase
MLTLLYSRVSTDKQSESGLGLDVQAKRNTALAHMLDRFAWIEFTDEGVSASIPFAQRPAGVRLMQQVTELVVVMRPRETDAILIAYDLSRLFRDVDDGRAMLKWFDDRGVRVFLSNEGGNAIDASSAMGRFLITIRLAQGEFERGLTGERTKAALGALKARGGRVGEPPYGWRKTVIKAKFEHDPTEQFVIDKILEAADDGESAREIARILNDNFKIATRDGKLWSHTQILRILGRAEYEGE